MLSYRALGGRTASPRAWRCSWGAFLCFLVGISAQKLAADGIGVGATLPDFSAPDENGETFELSSVAGKPLLLKFFRGHW